MGNTIVLGENCPGGNCPRWELSGEQLFEVEIVPGAIILGGNCPGNVVQGGSNCQGAIVQESVFREDIVLGGIVLESREFFYPY